MIIAALGNYDSKYKFTRHNAGFMVIDWILKKVEVMSKTSRSYGITWSCLFKGIEFDLFKPKSFMNTAGEKIAKVVKKTGCKPEEIAVVHDDMDIEPGEIKVKFDGGSAGHKGVESVILALNTRNFIRIRVGIGKPFMSDSGAEYVLEQPQDEEFKLLMRGVESAGNAALFLLEKGLNKTMSKFNKKTSS